MTGIDLWRTHRFYGGLIDFMEDSWILSLGFCIFPFKIFSESLKAMGSRSLKCLKFTPVGVSCPSNGKPGNDC